MSLYETIINDLKERPFLRDLKWHRGFSRFILKTEFGALSVGMWRHGHPSRDLELTVMPCYIAKFDILLNWFSKFDMHPPHLRKERPDVLKSGKAFNKPQEYEFLFDLSDYERQLACMCDDIESCAQNFFMDYSSLSNYYKHIIEPILNGTSVLPDIGADWLFSYLTSCRIIAPENYNRLKEILYLQADILASYSEPNLSYYYDRIPEIIGTMESMTVAELAKKPAHKKILGRTNTQIENEIRYEQYKGSESSWIMNRIAPQYEFAGRHYSCWIVRDGMIFDIHCGYPFDVTLHVKPLYADDIYWDIIGMPERKNESLSYRVRGCFAVPSVQIGEYSYDYEDSEFNDKFCEKVWPILFEKIQTDVEQFISREGRSEVFMSGKPLLQIIELIHNGRCDEAIRLAESQIAYNNQQPQYQGIESLDTEYLRKIILFCRSATV